MKVAILQLPSIGMSSAKIDYYLRIAQKKGVKVLLLGEYLLNPFFKELESLATTMIKEQSQHQIEALKELSKLYDVTIIAPLIVVKKEQVYKTIAKVSPTSISYYYQQLLINYTHWNEEKFFSNEKDVLKSPLVFKVDNIKFAVMFGFEMHFDEMFEPLKSKNIDALLVPSVATFESNERWKNLFSMRAFTQNYYILRANRVGEYKGEEHTWRFYGDSFLVNPFGEIEESLSDSEEMLVVDISHQKVLDARKFWGFKEAVKKR